MQEGKDPRVQIRNGYWAILRKVLSMLRRHCKVDIRTGKRAYKQIRDTLSQETSNGRSSPGGADHQISWNFLSQLMRSIDIK